ncbi:MAG TPA: protein tyrosine phosphatase [Verrucomicrobiota bacterium]|nr:protein tyrosine phosphatase [Verrucomicrobiota bacterium]
MGDSNVLPLKLLFICSRNRIRSLTAERIFGQIPGYQVRSAGTQSDARIVVTEGHVGWADIIFLMESSHLKRLCQKFPEAIRGKRVAVLRIPDQYQLMESELIDELQTKVSQHLPLPDLGPTS